MFQTAWRTPKTAISSVSSQISSQGNWSFLNCGNVLMAFQADQQPYLPQADQPDYAYGKQRVDLFCFIGGSVNLFDAF